MKKILLLFALSLMCFSAFSQDAVSLEGVAGLNISQQLVGSTKTGYRPGFHVGVRANYYITNPNTMDGLYANAALLLSLKGGKVVFDSNSSTLTSPCYLEAPVHVGYMYPITGNVDLFGELGPYFAFGLFGTSKTVLVGAASSTTGYFGSSTRRFDLGVGARIGARFLSQYSFSLGYDYGLARLYNDDTQSRNYNLYLSFGYDF